MWGFRLLDSEFRYCPINSLRLTIVLTRIVRDLRHIDELALDPATQEFDNHVEWLHSHIVAEPGADAKGNAEHFAKGLEEVDYFLGRVNRIAVDKRLVCRRKSQSIVPSLGFFREAIRIATVLADARQTNGKILSDVAEEDIRSKGVGQSNG